MVKSPLFVPIWPLPRALKGTPQTPLLELRKISEAEDLDAKFPENVTGGCGAKAILESPLFDYQGPEKVYHPNKENVKMIDHIILKTKTLQQRDTVLPLFMKKKTDIKEVLTVKKDATNQSYSNISSFFVHCPVVLNHKLKNS